MRKQFVEFENVEVVSDDGAGLLCRINDREVRVPHSGLAIADHMVRKPGDRGKLILLRRIAMELGLG